MVKTSQKQTNFRSKWLIFYGILKKQAGHDQNRGGIAQRDGQAGRGAKKRRQNGFGMDCEAPCDQNFHTIGTSFLKGLIDIVKPETYIHSDFERKSAGD